MKMHWVVLLSCAWMFGVLAQSPDVPYICPPGVDCVGLQVVAPIRAEEPIQCDDGFNGFYCVDGFNVTMCERGTYCPTASEQIECPDSHWCPSGSSSPFHCYAFSLCPAGVYKYQWALPFALLLITLLVGFIIHKCHERRMRTVLKQRQAHLPKELQDLLSNWNGTGGHAYTPAPGQLTVLFDNVDVELNTGGNRDQIRTILHKLTGQFTSGRLVAIMGPSGSGKTTFLNVLSGRFPLTHGKIALDIGEGTQIDLRHLHRVLGFVPQDDVMLPMLTVKDILTHSALTRLPKDWSTAEKMARVDAVISVLGLRKVADSAVGDDINRGISGGEKKRVNIGIELVANPLILFLDEPTSGLDASMAKDVVAALRRVSDLGTMVITVIHQPRFEIFEMFDDVLLLATGGYRAYLGPSSESEEFFFQMGWELPPIGNPADFYMDIISGRVPDRDNHYFAINAETRKKIDMFHQPEAVSQRQLSHRRTRGSSFQSEVNRNRASSRGSSGPPNMAYAGSSSSSQQQQQQQQRQQLQKQLLGSDDGGGNGGGSRPPQLSSTASTGSTSSSGSGGGRSKHHNSGGPDRLGVPPNNSGDNGDSSFHHQHVASFDVSSGPRYSSSFVPPKFGSGIELQTLPAFMEPNGNNSNLRIDESLLHRHTANFFLLVYLEVYRCLLMDLRHIWPLTLDTLLQMIPGIAMAIPGLGLEIYFPPLPLKLAQFCPAIIRDRCIQQAILGDYVVINCFFLTMVVGAASCVFAIGSYGRYLHVFWRERSGGLNIPAYFLGRVLYDVMNVFRNAFVFTACYLLLGSPRGSYAQWFFVMWCMMWAAYGMAYLISVIVPFNRAAIVAVVIAICSAVTSGLTPDIPTVNSWGPLPVFWYISYNRWASEAIMNLQTGGSENPRVAYTVQIKGYNTDNFSQDLAWMFLIGVGFRLLAFYFIRRSKPRK